MMRIITREDFIEFMEKADAADRWDDIEVEEWESACEFAGINYHDYDDPDRLWDDLTEVLNGETWSVELEAASWADDTFTGTYQQCLAYCRDNDYKIDGQEARLAKILLDGDGCVAEVLEIVEGVDE